MDSTTLKKEEMVEARVCVEISAEDDLLDFVPALVGKKIMHIPVSYVWSLETNGVFQFQNVWSF